MAIDRFRMIVLLYEYDAEICNIYIYVFPWNATQIIRSHFNPKHTCTLYMHWPHNKYCGRELICSFILKLGINADLALGSVLLFDVRRIYSTTSNPSTRLQLSIPCKEIFYLDERIFDCLVALLVNSYSFCYTITQCLLPFSHYSEPNRSAKCNFLLTRDCTSYRTW